VPGCLGLALEQSPNLIRDAETRNHVAKALSFPYHLKRIFLTAGGTTRRILFAWLIKEDN
jgi:hypothetical protein